LVAIALQDYLADSEQHGTPALTGIPSPVNSTGIGTNGDRNQTKQIAVTKSR
jgi:hypothetical protein